MLSLVSARRQPISVQVVVRALNPKESKPLREKSAIMKRRTSVGNRLLAALSPADLGLLAPHLQQISLKQDAVLVRSGDRNEQVYFPHSGTISFMLDMPNGQTVATSVIGPEGAVGMLSVLGPSRSPTTAVVRVPGIASQISASRFHAAFGQSSVIKQAVQTHTRALLMQFQHVAACNALHPVEARMARWLLHIQDRIDADAVPLTQEALSELLGVRRTTVTLVVSKLRAAGAVRSVRRGLVEIDRLRLEEAACECYKAMRCKYHQIFPAGFNGASQSSRTGRQNSGDRDPLLAE